MHVYLPTSTSVLETRNIFVSRGSIKIFVCRYQNFEFWTNARLDSLFDKKKTSAVINISKTFQNFGTNINEKINV